MTYVLCYWNNGKYNYINLSAGDSDSAITEATGILEDEHIDVYMRNEWEVQTI